MTQAARLERLERKVRTLERRIAGKRPETPEEERVRTRQMVLAHIRKNHKIDGFKFAIENDLHFGYVQEALLDLEKMGSIEEVEE